MSTSTELEIVMKVLSKTLLWCFVIGFLSLLLWFGFFLLGGDFAYNIHSKMFDITEHEFELMNYCGMAGLKIIVWMFFGVPYIATRLVLRGMRRGETE
jgi:hypothetical protein